MLVAIKNDLPRGFIGGSLAVTRVEAVLAYLKNAITVIAVKITRAKHTGVDQLGKNQRRERKVTAANVSCVAIAQSEA